MRKVVACPKFKSKCFEESNEIIYLVNCKIAETNGAQRVNQLSKNVTALEMQGGVWLSRKQMRIVTHAESMSAV